MYKEKEMKALELLGRLSLNMCVANPMERIAISGTDVHEAIIELNALSSQITELRMMEEDAQQYALKCKKELEALQSRSCESCKYGTAYIGTDRKWCEANIQQDGMTTVDKDFCCNRYEAKGQ